MVTTEFSAQLQFFRKKKGITQEQLAQKVGVSPQAVSKWENGSYPDGELLPIIASELGISIDALYGNEKPDVSFEQSVLNEIHKLVEKDKNGSFKEVIPKMMDIVWATVIPCWKDNVWYWGRPAGDKLQLQTVSLITSDSGFANIRHNSDLQYAVIMQKPEKGYESFFEYDDNLLELFRFMSDRANMKILYYLNSLGNTELFTEKSVSAALGVSPESVKSAISYLCKKGFTREMKFDDGTTEKIIYAYHRRCGLLILLAGEKTLLTQNEVYQIQVGNNEQPFFDKSKLSFLKKGKDNEKK